MIQLRQYQLDSVASIIAAIDPLVVAPTGSGKTVIASEIIRRAVNKHVLFLAHRRELIKQTKKHLAEFGVPAGIILAGEPMDLTKAVQVGSVQTFHSRTFVSAKICRTLISSSSTKRIMPGRGHIARSSSPIPTPRSSA